MLISDLGSAFSRLLTLAIPIIAIVGGISFAAYSMYLRVRRQREMFQLYHAERMAAIEKGIELPPLPPEMLNDARHGPWEPVGYRYRHRRNGVTLLFIGVAITVAIWAQGGNSFWWGFVIIAWGLGRLVSDQMEAHWGAADPRGPASFPPRSGNGDSTAPGQPPGRN